MAAIISDAVLDAALDYIINTGGKVLHICSAKPATFASVAGVSLGNKAGPTVGTKADGDVSGRKCTITAIADGTLTGAGTVTAWALVGTGSSFLVSQSTSSATVVGASGTFTTNAIDIEIPDPTA